MQFRRSKSPIFFIFKAVLFITFLQLSAWAHTPSPDEIELPPVDLSGYEIKVIEGNWSSEAEKAPQAQPNSLRQNKVQSAAVLKKDAVQEQDKKVEATQQRTDEESPQTNISSEAGRQFEKKLEPQFSPIHVFKSYLLIGFEHILPEGTDHILFVLGLFFFGFGWRVLLMQISIFTLAHTVTLILSTMHFIRLPSEIVEPVIAFSIVFIALENLFLSKLTWRRLVLIFSFGLIHGLGFAGALAEIKLPENRQLLALISFNLGVELGQLTVVSCAGALLFIFFKKSWYKKRIANPVSVLIAVIGLYWTVTRIFF